MYNSYACIKDYLKNVAPILKIEVKVSQIESFENIWVVYTFIWMRNLDNNCRNQEKFRGSGNVVLQENVKNIMERKEDK